MSQRPTASFTSVDAEPAGNVFFNALDEQSRHPAIIEIRDAALRFLRLEQEQHALDVGCGTGETTISMADIVSPGGRAVGIDASELMVTEARRRHGSAATFEVGDATALGFPDDRFDGARCERTFQHLEEPDAALREMIRVVRPGGRLVVIDMDWDTAVMDLADKEVARRLSRAVSDRFIRSGTIGRRLYGMFHRAGLEEVEVRPVVMIVNDVKLPGAPIAHLNQGVHALHGMKVFDDAERDATLAQIESVEREGFFLAAVTLFAVAGRIPPAV